MFSILKKELHTFFSSATGYVVIAVFLSLTGLFLWVIPGQFNVLDAGYANVDGLFYLAPRLFLFLCTAVSMRFFAEEKQTGTWEILATKPVSEWQMVLGKYFAGTVLVLLALIPTIIYYFSVSYLAEPVGNVDSGQFWGSFIGLFFLTAVYIAIGTFASVLSKNQIIAFITGLALSFFFYYGFDLISSFFSNGKIIQFVDNLGIRSHYYSLSRGIIDSRDVVYFVVLCTLFLYLTVRKLNHSKK
ncbi:MAG: gliding motility-associated ABC transporter permease subunit GldF [Paludibacteraceae bacterium]